MNNLHQIQIIMNTTKYKRVHHCIVVTKIGHAGFYLPVVSAVNSSIDDIKSFAECNPGMNHRVSLVTNHRSDKFAFLYKDANIDDLKLIEDFIPRNSYKMSLSGIFEELSEEFSEDDLVLVTFISESIGSWNDKRIDFYYGLTTNNIKPIITHYSSKGWKFLMYAFGNMLYNCDYDGLCESLSFDKVDSLEPYIQKFYDEGQPYPDPFNYNPTQLNYIRVWKQLLFQNSSDLLGYIKL